MKKLIISALIAVTMTAQAQTTIDPYQPMMDAFDKQAEKIMNEFKAIQEKDPKGELPATWPPVSCFMQNKQENMKQVLCGQQ